MVEQLRNCEDVPPIKRSPDSSPVTLNRSRPIESVPSQQLAKGPSRHHGGGSPTRWVNYLSKQSVPTHRTETVQAAPRTIQGAPGSGSTVPLPDPCPIVTRKTQVAETGFPRP